MIAAVIATHDRGGCNYSRPRQRPRGGSSVLRLMLASEADIEVISEAENGERSVFEVLANRPDVVVMDLRMPGSSASTQFRRCFGRSLEPGSWFFSMQDDPRYVRQAFEAGERMRPGRRMPLIPKWWSGARGRWWARTSRLVRSEQSPCRRTAERRRAESDPLSDRRREVLRPTSRSVTRSQE